MTFIEWLSHEMQLRGMNQAELADRAGVTRGAVSHLLSGARRPGVEMLHGLAQALGLPVEQLFRAAGLLENETPAEALETPPNLGEWVRMFLQADEDTRELMLENARFFSQRERRKKRA